VSSAKTTLFIAFIYAFSGKFGQILAIEPGNITAFWPPSGLALAAILMYGLKRSAAGIMLGAFFINTLPVIWADSEIQIVKASLAGIGIAVGSLLQPALGYAALRRLYQCGSTMGLTAKSLFILFLIAPAMCLVSATIGNAVFNLTRIAAFNLQAWVTWWIGDTVGVLLFTPFFLAFLPRKNGYKLCLLKVWEPAVVLLGVVGISYVIFETIPDVGWSSVRFEFFIIPLLFAIAYRYSRSVLLLALVSVSVVATGAYVDGARGMEDLDPNTSLILLQFYLSTVICSTLLFSAIIQERNDTQKSLKQTLKNLEHTVEAKTLQLKASQQKLHHSEKMQAIGQLAGGIAHDFNNQLMGISGFVESVKHEHGKDSVLLKNCNDILKIVAQSADLTKKLLAFGRRDTVEKQPLDLHELIRELYSVLERIFNKNISLDFEPSASESVVFADKVQLQNVFLNLALNARDAMSAGGALTVFTRNVSPEQLDVHQKEFNLQEPTYIEIQILDTGCGIKESNMHHIFEPFFTTKPPGEGTGMGLAAAYGTVVSHGGGIWLESAEGVGTNFFVVLPLSKIKLQHDSCPIAPLAEVRPRKCMVVDDETTVRLVARKFLEKMGMQVIACQSGEEALGILSQDHSVEFVLLDIIMPGMGGEIVLEKLRKFRPHLPVIISSGYGEPSQLGLLQNSAVHGFLPKPYSYAQLQELLRTT